MGEREVYEKISIHLTNKYHLGKDKKQNERMLAEAGYIFGDKINGQILSGEFVRTSSALENEQRTTIHKAVDTHKYGIYLMHSIDMIKSAINVQTPKVKTILERLFRKKLITTKNIVVLNTKEFYAFVINNACKLRQDFKESTACSIEQTALVFKPKTIPFAIPEQDFYKYDPTVKDEVEYLSNAYAEYTSGFATSIVRSTSEMLFEKYCEKKNDIDWVYKNGDSGQQYFSIVYIDAMQHQWLFYADYIIKKNDGTIWIIETKGGESKGKDKNIDIQIENKFNAFKLYAVEHELH